MRVVLRIKREKKPLQQERKYLEVQLAEAQLVSCSTTPHAEAIFEIKWW